MKASTFFLGLTTGAVAAAVTVLYSTPKSGDEIRRSLTNTDCNEICQELKLKATQFKDALTDDQFPCVIERFKKALNNFKEPVESAQNKFEKELSAIQQSLDRLEQSISSTSK